MYTKPKFGEVYRAIRDIQIMGIITYKRPASSGFSAALPKGTKIVIMNDPPPDAVSVEALPLNYKELEKRIVPKEEYTLDYYQGYGISVLLEYLSHHFVKEDINMNRIKFDDKQIQKEWKFIIKKYKEQKDLQDWLYEGSPQDYQNKIKQIEKQIMEDDEAQGRAKIIRIDSDQQS